MMAIVYYLCIFITVFPALPTVNALKCYKCIKEGCGDPFDKTNPSVSHVDCVGVCMTRTFTGFTPRELEAKSPFKVGDVMRGCYPSTSANSTKKPGCVEEENNGAKGTACYCDKPLCNGDSAAMATITTRGVTMTIWTLILIVFCG